MSKYNSAHLCERASQAVANGDLNGAKRLFKLALRQYEPSIEARLGLATTYFLLERYPRAIRFYRAVLALDRDHVLATINLGVACARDRRYSEGQQYLERASELAPQCADVHFNLGVVYRKLARPVQAVEAYQRALEINPRLLDAVFNLANVLFERELYPEAAECYRRAMEIDPTFLKARIGFEKAARLDPRSTPGPREAGSVWSTHGGAPRNGKRKLKRLEHQNGVLIKMFARQYRRLRRLMDEQARVFAVLSAG